jgi:Ca2+/H+ antiporter
LGEGILGSVAFFSVMGHNISMKKQKKRTTLREDTGKILIDLGKVVFGSIFLGGFLRGEIPHTILVISGFVVTLTFFVIGLLWVTKEKKADEDNTSSAK